MHRLERTAWCGLLVVAASSCSVAADEGTSPPLAVPVYSADAGVASIAEDKPDAVGPFCMGGASCAPVNACHIGKITCASGAPVCADMGSNVADGNSCGGGQICARGTCIPCFEGAACALSDPCHGGVLSCTTSAPVCADKGTNAPEGTPCGSNQVCEGGTCVACSFGSRCALPNRCHIGATTCNGVPGCNDTGAKAADGTSCGIDQVCDDGNCVGCTQGASCTPGVACHAGTISCTLGTPACADTGTNAANGTSCGTNQVCAAGTCGACVQAAPCTPANTCHIGALACSSGGSACNDTGSNAQDGSSCGTNRVCSGGGCVACTQGASCAPSDACHVGRTSCSTGSPVCIDTGANAANGTSCGANQFCAAGTCGSCVQDGACPPPNPCHTGKLACSSGASVCNDTGSNTANGTTCGANQVCNRGSCIGCAQGSVCSPGNLCHVGATSCSTGAPVCVDTVVNAANGTSCGTNQVCGGGSCVACREGATCTPANRCHAGTIACASGTPVCNDTGANATDGTICGQGQACTSGACTPCGGNTSCAPGGPQQVLVRITGGSWLRIFPQANTSPEDLSASLTAVSAGTDGIISVSADGSWLVMYTSRFGCSGTGCLAYIRSDLSQPGQLVLPGGSQLTPTGRPLISADGRTILFERPGNHMEDIFKVELVGSTWSQPVNLTAASSRNYNHDPSLSADALHVIFDCGDDPYGDTPTTAACEVATDASGFRVVVAPSALPSAATDAYTQRPGYAPDGSIVLEGNPGGFGGTGERIYRYSGTTPQLVGNFGNDNSPCVFADGTIASLWLGRPGNSTGVHELKIMSASGASYDMPVISLDLLDIGLSCGGGP